MQEESIRVEPVLFFAVLKSRKVPVTLFGMPGKGIETAMLYVESSNASANLLYEKLGFALDHIDRAYVADLGPATPRD